MLDQIQLGRSGFDNSAFSITRPTEIPRNRDAGGKSDGQSNNGCSNPGRIANPGEDKGTESDNGNDDDPSRQNSGLPYQPTSGHEEHSRDEHRPHRCGSADAQANQQPGDAQPKKPHTEDKGQKPFWMDEVSRIASPDA